MADLERMPAERDDPVIHELGIPLNTLYYRAILDPPTGWEGYRLEVIGTKKEDPDPPDAVHWIDMFGLNQTLIIIAWCRRVYWKKAPSVYLEVRWHPETGETIALKGLEWNTTQESLKRLHQGLKLLKAIKATGGRPLGNRKIPPEEFRQQYHDKYQQLLDVYESKPRRREVAEALGLDETTFRTYLKYDNLPFPPF
jgi:hypothetical protein